MPTIYRLIHAGIISVFLSLFLSCSIAHSIEDHDQKAFFACPSSQSDTDMTEKPDQSDSFRKSSADFIHELSEKHHFDKNELACLFDQIEPNPTTIRLVTPASTPKPKNWQAYRQRMIEPTRISAGLRFWNQYETYLNRAEKKFGVPPHIIVGILGIESVYGNHTGNFRTIDALATLAFDYPETANQSVRKASFREELENLLLLSRENGTNPMNFYGSYAGAIGYPQFMPGSIRRYAIDFDGDGKIDLENSAIDAIGSIANFLLQHGWNEKQPIVFPVRKTPDCTMNETLLNQGLEARFTPAQLKKECIVPDTNIPDGILYGLIDLPNGFADTEYWIGSDNFFAITHYNRSYFYAMSVILLGEEILRKKDIDG